MAYIYIYIYHLMSFSHEQLNIGHLFELFTHIKLFNTITFLWDPFSKFLDDAFEEYMLQNLLQIKKLLNIGTENGLST